MVFSRSFAGAAVEAKQRDTLPIAEALNETFNRKMNAHAFDHRYCK
jgi:hypothetical protein